MSILVYHEADPSEAAAWKYYAAASATLVQVAWWERLLIFPIDRAATALRSEKDAGQGWLDDGSLKQLHRLLDRWGWYHSMRASLPFLAALVVLYGKSNVTH
jgi:hypothetical protein